MENLKVGFIGTGEFATFTLYPALHFALLELQAICVSISKKPNATPKNLVPGLIELNLSRPFALDHQAK